MKEMFRIESDGNVVCRTCLVQSVERIDIYDNGKDITVANSVFMESQSNNYYSSSSLSFEKPNERHNATAPDTDGSPRCRDRR